jgi:hypothetical protein
MNIILRIIMFVLGKELERRKSFRTSVVPYTIIKNKQQSSIITYDIWYLLGVDADHNEITDHGGGIKKNEYDLDAAERELFEETREIFGDLKDKLSFCISAVREPPPNTKISHGHGGMSVIFLPIENDWLVSNKAILLFERAKNKVTTDRSHHELSELLWINDKKFSQLIKRSIIPSNRTPAAYNRRLPKERKMWPKLRAFYDSFYSENLETNLTDQWLQFYPS